MARKRLAPPDPHRDAGDRLAVYAAKRNFDRTPEPAAATEALPSDAPRFVVQEHRARSLHYDFRLEHDGVLVSWALPKGLPEDPAVNHLAVPTEDHPLSYVDFEGKIPAGNYGAGSVRIVNRGTYEIEKWRPNEVMVVLRGTTASGRYVLFPTGERRWMIHKMADEPTADSPPDAQTPEAPTADGPSSGPKRSPRTVTRAPLARIEPMLATPSLSLPEGDGWAFELKWDGVRVLARVAGGSLTLVNRRGVDVTERYPELAVLPEGLTKTDVVVDGEVVALDADGRPDFGRLQHRMHASAERARRLVADFPVVYVVFDILDLDGTSLIDRPYEQRRGILGSLGLTGGAWQVPAEYRGDGADLLAEVRRTGLEGVVAKRLESSYEPGRRSTSWLKVKALRRQELVVGGWLEGRKSLTGQVGALLVGHYSAGALRYAGRVGTGIAAAKRLELERAVAASASDTPPFDPVPVIPAAAGVPHWLKPELVVEVAFTEWTRTGTLRHPVLKGLRDDKEPSEVVREPIA